MDTAAPTPEPSNQPPKRLYRSISDRKIAGICGGIAEYFNIDATVVRIIAVVLLLPGGLPGFLPYIVLWVVIPEPSGKNSLKS